MNLKLRNLLAYSLPIKLMLALWIPLTLDEYYYFLWGQYLSLSYFDHPPMVGWIMNLSQPFTKFGEGAIRWPFILLTHGSIFLWIQVLKDRLSKEKLYWFTLVALLNPLWGMGALIATPDIPLVFFWSLSIWALDRFLKNPKGSESYLLAAAMACGFLSKYQMVLFLPPLLWVLWQQRQFRQLFSWRGLGALIIGLVVCSPVFIWNAQNNWASFEFQWQHGMSSDHWRWYWPLEYLGTQILIIFPVFLIPLRHKQWRRDVLAAFALFPLLFFFYSSFKGRVEGNWVIMSLPSVYALAILYGSNQIFQWQKRTVYLWTLILILAAGLPLMRSPLPENKIKLFESSKFEAIESALKPEQNYFAYNFQMAGYLSYKKQRLICKFPLYGRPDHFNYMDRCQVFPDHFYYITRHWERPPLAKDLPDHIVIGETKIDSEFKMIEVRKR